MAIACKAYPDGREFWGKCGVVVGTYLQVAGYCPSMDARPCQQQHESRVTKTEAVRIYKCDTLVDQTTLLACDYKGRLVVECSKAI
jgi:hypothetical protein